jgi:CubicO group peptidase (beta-lactamase class C family)
MTRTSAAKAFLEGQRAGGIFPGARYRIARGPEILEDGWLGCSVVEPETIAVAGDTIYDLASLTKPLVTGALAALLAARGVLSLQAPLRQLLPETSDSWVGQAPLLDLLCHRSGLPAWIPIYLSASDRGGYLRTIAALPREYRAGARVTYSCLGYILMGLAIERVTGAPLDELARREIFDPLGLRDTRFLPPGAWKQRIAATERGNAREKELAGVAGRSFGGWRSHVLWGECHDLNAWTLGGVSGNAGLFSTASEVHAMALEFLNSGKGLYDRDTVQLLRTDQTPGLNENRSVGWQLALTPGCSAGPEMSPQAIGHTGFTGTSLWIDPTEGWILILLTNRVHPEYRPDDMNAVRRGFHRAVLKPPDVHGTS